MPTTNSVSNGVTNGGSNGTPTQPGPARPVPTRPTKETLVAVACGVSGSRGHSSLGEYRAKPHMNGGKPR